MLVCEPDQLGVERAHPQLAFGARLVELAETHRHVAADDDRTPARLDHDYIASGGGRDFMRPISQDMYGVSRDRVIGSATALEYTSDDHGGTITRKAEADYLDNGPQKPIRIWSRTGRRPLLAAGNSNGDVQMLDFTQHPDKSSLRLLVLHDDAEREFDYTSGAEHALERAATAGWTVVSIKKDWATVF